MTRSGFSKSLEHLPNGLYHKVTRCGDCLVVLVPQLISNITSNIAECYTGLHTICYGGKQYNRIQFWSFEQRCYTADLQAQHGPQWGVQLWKEVTGESVNKV